MGDVSVSLDMLTRPQRLMLKRAYAATVRRPLHIVGSGAMLRVAEQMIDMHLIEKVPQQFFAIRLTSAGFKLATELRRQGWPNCEKTKR